MLWSLFAAPTEAAQARFTQPDAARHPNLFTWTDTCNVHVIRDGDAALLIDLGDNIGGGSAGDGTVLLAELLKQHAKGFVVPMYAPAAVEQAKAAGIGRAVEVAVGGSTGDLHGPQLRVRGTCLWMSQRSCMPGTNSAGFSCFCSGFAHRPPLPPAPWQTGLL